MAAIRIGTESIYTLKHRYTLDIDIDNYGYHILTASKQFMADSYSLTRLIWYSTSPLCTLLPPTCHPFVYHREIWMRRVCVSGAICPITCCAGLKSIPLRYIVFLFTISVFRLFNRMCFADSIENSHQNKFQKRTKYTCNRITRLHLLRKFEEKKLNGNEHRWDSGCENINNSNSNKDGTTILCLHFE